MRKFASLFALLCVLGPLAACSVEPEGEGLGHRQQTLALDPQQELEIGRQAYRQILGKSRVVHSGPQVDAVRRVGQRIAKVVAIEPLNARD